MDQLRQDLRYAFRSLIRQPAFSLAAVLMLALGIGATSAMFGVVNAVLLRPLPFQAPDRVVAVLTFWTKTGVRAPNLSAPDFEDFRAQSRSFDTLALYWGGETSVTVGGTGDYATVYHVSQGFFEAVGATAAVGRLLSADELRPGGPLAVVITDAFWRRQFNADPSALGSTIRFGDRPYTLVGVLAPGQRYPARADIFGPEWVTPRTTSRGAHNYRVIGRLAEGVTVEQAQAELSAIARRLEEEYPGSNTGKSVAVVPLQDVLVGETRQTLYVLFAAVGLVLLIACANVANLLLARATARGREMVVRAAIGAGRGRLVRQLLTESLVLGAAAAVAGVGVARLGVFALGALAPENLPRLDEVRVDGAVLLFAVAVALLATAILGLAPALQLSRVQLVDGLRQGGKGTAIGARSGWARSAFVVAEIALAVVLVFAAGLLGKSLVALASVEMGFAPRELMVMNTVVPVSSLEEAPRATAFYRDLLGHVRSLPGVAAASAVTSLPTAVRSNGSYGIEGKIDFLQAGIRAPKALFTVVTPDYFRTLGVPIRRGRDFNDGDRRDAPFVAIINESLARESFPGEDPIGKRIQCGLDSLEPMTIVGVVADIRTAGPTRPVQPEIYMPYEQHPGPATALNLVIRTERGDPQQLAGVITRAIRERNPDVPVKVTSMEATIGTAAAAPRFRAFLLVTLAGIALLLAIAGVYAVMAYSVTQRLPELGVRVALGATPGSILALVLKAGAGLAAGGIALGLGLSLLAGRVLESLLFQVTARDPMMLALVPAAVAVATLAACCMPARRAGRVDPMIVLRAE
ncbi:MAG TPA: ABC transporter permease [Vicinamibacterales bacterium]